MDIDNIAVQAREWVNHDRERRSVIVIGLERNVLDQQQIGLTFCMSGNDKNLRSSFLNAMKHDGDFDEFVCGILSDYVAGMINEEEDNGTAEG